MFRQNYREVDEWLSEGLPLSTTSNRCAKLFDASITQYVGWFDDPNFGGLSNTIETMINEDPNFVMGRALSIGLELIGTAKSIRLDSQFKAELEQLEKLANQRKGDIGREFDHVNALSKFANRDINGATVIWENILIDYPTDILALKFAHDCYFYLGKQSQLRDSIARVIPHWNDSLPLKSYLHGMYAFGLEETNLYEKAEIQAKKALAENAYDGWAVHALSHIREMNGKIEDGIELMSSTENEWRACNYLACHNYWHWALYHIEQQRYDTAIDIFENQIAKRVANNNSMLDIMDASSLLYRLNLVEDGVVSDQHWQQIYRNCKPHLNDHILGFNDLHFLMACLGSKHNEDAQQVVKTLQSETNLNCSAFQVTNHLMKAMMAYNDEDYVRAVDYLNEVRYQIIDIGGSNAQRDVFNLLLIVAALKSPLVRHNRLVHSLLNERNAQKTTPLLNRLIDQSNLN